MRRQAVQVHVRDEVARPGREVLVVHLEQLGDVKAHGAVLGAVAAARAGDGPAAAHLARDVRQHGQLLLAQRRVDAKGLDVLLDLLHVGHAGQGHHDLRHALDKAEAPLDVGLLRARGAQALLVLGCQLGELAAAHGFHDPHRDPALGQHLDLGLGVLELPVKVVELDLTKLHVLPVGVQKAAHTLQAPVGREAQMPYPTCGFLFQQVLQDAVLWVQVEVDVLLGHVMEEIEIKEVEPGLLKLLLEDLLDLLCVGRVVAGELGRDVVGAARVASQGDARGHLRDALVVGPGGVKVIDALLKGIVDHPVHGLLVDLAVVAL